MTQYAGLEPQIDSCWWNLQ